MTPSELGRPAVLTLMQTGWRPPDEEITQSYGICFSDNGIVLAAWDTDRWNLPGGTIEADETPEDALIREVGEEACATVTDYCYIASQHVWDPESPDGRTSYYQSRWWARVYLDNWHPQHEMIARIEVVPADFLTTLCWKDKTIAARLLDLALGVNEQYARSISAGRP